MGKVEQLELEAAGARGFPVKPGDQLRIINSFGTQVIAAWAFLPPKGREHMSMEHSRIHSKTSRPQPGTVFYTNHHNPVLELASDSSPRVHDWFLAACNQKRYEMLGHDGPHASCEGNLLSVLKDFDYDAVVPCPLNLFENVPVMYGSAMEIKAPLAMPRDDVCLRAKAECLIVLSSCPQDILETNGPERTPRPVQVELTPKA